MNKTSFGIACALIVYASAAAYFKWVPFVLTTQSASTTPLTAAPAQNERIVPKGLREYRNTEYNFSLLYPEDLSISEHAEGGGAATITFQNVKKVVGFQIFIIPYAESQISDARFREDVPSGVRESLKNITIDGATGAAFLSTSDTLGATREVWFINKGYLYEVTTMRSLDAWLDGIMQTWKFIK